MEEKPTTSPPSSGDVEIEKHDPEKASSTQAENKDVPVVQPAPGKEDYVPPGDFVYPTPQEEAAVIWKLDKRLIPIVFFLYMLSVLDRSNLGNAKLAGLEDGQFQSIPSYLI